MAGMAAFLVQRRPAPRQVRDRTYRAPTPCERERWHGRWPLAQGWSADTVADLLERDGPAARAFAQTGGPPPPSTPRRGRG